MPYANNQGVKIYYEVEGQGPPIAFIHGATGNLTSWRSYGYVDLLRDKYTLILIDARGHGQSDKPHNFEEYNYRLQVEDVIAVLDALQIDKTHFWGYSLGGTIGFGLVKHYPQRLLSLIVGGSTPYGEAEPPTTPPDPFILAMQAGAKEGPDAAICDLRKLFGEITPGYEARLRVLDYQAQSALLEYLYYHHQKLADVLPTMAIPYLVYMSDGDDPDFAHTKGYLDQIANATLVELRDCNHVSANTKLDVIVPAVLEFLAKAS